jgi:AcrR family transcriptional regulator
MSATFNQHPVSSAAAPAAEYGCGAPVGNPCASAVVTRGDEQPRQLIPRLYRHLDPHHHRGRGHPQASLYHYFKTKDDILCALLSQTVTPTLTVVNVLAGTEPALSAAEHLHALALFDGRQLLDGRWNLGALYLQPELRGARLEPFWSDRERLRLHYLTLSKAIVTETGVDEAAADLPFRLVESLVNMWTKRPGPERTKLPEHVADACIRVLGMPDSATPGLRARSHLELSRYAVIN